MNDHDDADFLDDADDFEIERDEEELTTAPRQKAVAWKKIDSLREKIALRNALSDFEDYHV